MTFTDGDALNAYAEEVSALRTRLAEVEAERGHERELLVRKIELTRKQAALIAQLREALGEMQSAAAWLAIRFDSVLKGDPVRDATEVRSRVDNALVATRDLLSSPASIEPSSERGAEK